MTAIEQELAKPVDPRVTAFAAHIAAPYPTAARAVLFYGSCLRSTELDGQMLDFYLIVSDYDAAYGGGWKAKANRLLPPNVFPAQHENLAAKYAVLSEADFARLCSTSAKDVSVWARFAQPSRLVWGADAAAHSITAAAIANAPRTLIAATLSLFPTLTDPLELFRQGFALTYSAELRAERSDRPASVVEFDPGYYRAIGSDILAAGVQPMASDGEGLWRNFRRRGKLLTIARLTKASFTYAGGIDYLAWKINRHAGTHIAIKPWQRRWPLLGAVVLLPRLLAKGAVK